MAKEKKNVEALKDEELKNASGGADFKGKWAGIYPPGRADFEGKWAGIYPPGDPRWNELGNGVSIWEKFTNSKRKNK